MNIKSLWRDYSLSIVLGILFILSWAAQASFQWTEFASNTNMHNQSAKVEEFLPEFFSATFENWQSEFLQLFTMVVLTSFLVHKGAPESKDSEEKVEQALARIEEKLNALNSKKS
jgi:hypothetical protein